MSRSIVAMQATDHLSMRLMSSSLAQRALTTGMEFGVIVDSLLPLSPP